MTQPAQPASSGAASAAAPGKPKEDLSARAARLERELAAVRAEMAGEDAVKLKVEEPHAAFVHAGLTIGTEYTAVPASSVAAVMEAADNSGVTLTQEEG